MADPRGFAGWMHEGAAPTQPTNQRANPAGFAGWMHGAGAQMQGPSLVDEIYNRIQANMLEMANRVVRLAEQYAPKKTGRLAASIGFDWNAANFQVVFTVDAPYGIFVEYGTRNMMAQPYLRRALNTVGPQYGFNLEMAFTSTPHINKPLMVHGARYAMPPTLTPRQREHVIKNLTPVARHHHYVGHPYTGALTNVGRARLHVRRR